MARKRGGKNNGIKHGAYAEDLILPDENGDEFLQLYQALTEEWKPVGALEEDTVLTLTQCIWAKRRVERFYYREATGGQFQGKDQIKYVIYLVELLEKTKTLEDATVITSRLPETYRLWIAQEVPRSNFQDDQSWIQALTPRIIDLAGAYANFASATLSTYKSNNSTYLRELTAKSRRKTLLRLLRPIVAKNVHAKTNFTGNSLRSDGSAGRRAFAMIQNYRGTALHANCR